ncbi:MAG: hypothetical protein QXS80_06530, partial [Candidatus Caldarchaeum sp.]
PYGASLHPPPSLVGPLVASVAGVPLYQASAAPMHRRLRHTLRECPGPWARHAGSQPSGDEVSDEPRHGTLRMRLSSSALPQQGLIGISRRVYGTKPLG